MIAVRLLLIACLGVAATLLHAKASAPGQLATPHTLSIRVTVVVVLCSTENNVVDKKLTELARELEKRGSPYRGFERVDVLKESIAVGETHAFNLLGENVLNVTVLEPRNEQGRVGLRVSCECGVAANYHCVCDKFSLFYTNYKTKDGRRLMACVGAKPCNGNGP